MGYHDVGRVERPVNDLAQLFIDTQAYPPIRNAILSISLWLLIFPLFTVVGISLLGNSFDFARKKPEKDFCAVFLLERMGVSIEQKLSNIELLVGKEGRIRLASYWLTLIKEKCCNLKLIRYI